MKVLLTGGAGYIGSFTTRALQKKGFEIEILDNLSTGHIESVPAGVRFHNCDLLNSDEVNNILRSTRFEGLIHFAAKSLVGESVADPLKYYQNNVVGSLNLITAAKKNGVENIIFSSTAAVYGNPIGELNEEHPTLPINPYGRSKLAVERILSDSCKAYGIKCIPLRYFNAAGADMDGQLGEDHDPESHLIPLAIGAAFGQRPPLKVFGNDYYTSDGTPIRDYVHVKDLAEAHVSALVSLSERESGYFCPMNVGTGRGSSVLDVIKAVENATGLKVPWSLSPRRAGDPEELVASSAKLKAELNWVPQYSSLEILTESASKWHRLHPNGYKDLQDHSAFI